MPKKPIRLLIAEDEESIRASLENYVRKHTTVFDEVFGVGTGQEALDIIFRYHPQVMLLDHSDAGQGRPPGAGGSPLRRRVPEDDHPVRA